MRDFRIGPLTLLLITVAWTLPSRADDASLKVAADQWATTGWPLLEKYCLDCHNADYQEAEIDLSGYRTLDGVSQQSGAMQRVLEMVRFGAMPPEDSALPSEQERKTLVASLDRTLFAVSCDLRPRPGKVTARRLNRAEYNNTIRDLFGMDLNPADAFPSDEVGAGFDNNGDVLSLSPMLIEKYLDAAEMVSTAVLVDPATIDKLSEERPSDQLLVHGDNKTGSFNGRFLAPETVVWAEFEAPYQGEYRVRISAGSNRDDRKPMHFAVYDETGLLIAKEELKYYGGSGSSQSFELKLDLEIGLHRILVDPIEDADAKLEVGKTRVEKFDQLDPQWVAAAKERAKTPLKPDGRIDEDQYPAMVRQISMYGPSGTPKEALPPSQYQILKKTAKRERDRWTGVEAAAAECLKPLMRRAFRGPVTDEEVARYAELVSMATERDESYYRGLQVAISAVLVSPRFLFRVETPPDDYQAEEDGSVRLTQHQLATRLSYFLWSSAPDQQLLDAADKGQLSEKELRSQVQRMLADPKSDALARQFAAQWLGLRNLTQHEADTKRFPSFTASLREAMARETEMVFTHLVRNNRPVAELLTADYTFVNEELAAHYGIDGVSGNEFQQVSLSKLPRRGVLSHASVLTLTSNPGRTSPVKRGKWILENVLGTPPPDPPAGVPELDETETASAEASFREQLEIHRANPSCAACHRVMDQLGFGLEQFDAVGRYREREGKLAVDASGELPGGRSFNGAAELCEVLGKTEVTAFAHTVTERLMTFALGRELTPADRCTVDAIVEKTAKDNHRFVDLILEVVHSRPYLYYDWSLPDPSHVSEVN